MLVDIGEAQVFLVETDQIETMQDYGHRHGCEIVLVSGRRLQMDSSARTIRAKIEDAQAALAKKLLGKT